MNHTPGPWKVEKGGFVGGPVGYGFVCQFWNKHEEDFKNSEANAELVAAAPELLEVLKRYVYPEFEGGCFDAMCGCCTKCSLRETARQIITKAEGTNRPK